DLLLVGRGVVRRPLDVDVDRLEPVRVDDLLIGRRERTGAGTGVLEPRTAGAAEGDDDVTAVRPDVVDRGLVLAAGQRAPAVPLRVAVAAVQHEGHREPLDAGRVHDRDRVGRVAPAGVE